MFVRSAISRCVHRRLINIPYRINLLNLKIYPQPLNKCRGFKCLLIIRWLVVNPFPSQTIQYMAKNRVVQTETRELASLNRGKIKAGETDDWRNEQLYVPPLPPTNLRGCHIIRIQYDVFVSCPIFSRLVCRARNDDDGICVSVSNRAAQHGEAHQTATAHHVGHVPVT